LAGRHFQVILANINRNVLIADMPSYVRSLSAGGTILFSGIFVTDEPLIRSTAEGLGLIFEGMEEKNNWVVLQFKKN
jgi:ribosomal protein L11 methyltransferase